MTTSLNLHSTYRKMLLWEKHSCQKTRDIYQSDESLNATRCQNAVFQEVCMSCSFKIGCSLSCWPVWIGCWTQRRQTANNTTGFNRSTECADSGRIYGALSRESAEEDSLFGVFTMLFTIWSLWVCENTLNIHISITKHELQSIYWDWAAVSV